MPKKLEEFRGALGWINPAGFSVSGRVYCAPEPVALVRQRPLTGRFFSVPAYGAPDRSFFSFKS
jgi:hypothetical protein